MGVYMEINYRTMGKRIALARKKLNLTQEEVSTRVDIGLDHYAHIETGSSCSLTVLIRILKELNVSSDYVFAEILPSAKYVLESELSDLIQGCTNEQIAALKVVAEAFANSNKK